MADHKDDFRQMPADFVKLFDRYMEEVLHEPSAPVEARAAEIYARYYDETPRIGGKDNPMASNLYGFITSIAYFEATDGRLGVDSVETIMQWRMAPMRSLAKVFDLNRGWVQGIFNFFVRKIAKKTEEKKKSGEWGSTWSMLVDPEEHHEGCSVTLVGCPLAAFARAHGYMDILPKFCAIDHASIGMLHGKLIRLHTEATGGEGCDYWIVGDRSETARKYKDLPEL